MTPTHYFVARIARTFGLHRKNKRMSDAASEMHLLREAETYLGHAVWENVADVEELAMEYWNLRKLSKEREEIHKRLVTCEQQLAKAHEERSALLGQASEPHQELLARRSVVMAELESLARQRDAVVDQARTVKRAFEGTKMKLEVLSKDPSQSQADLDATRERLRELKARFTELKIQRAEIADNVEAGDRELDRIDHELAEKRHERRDQASEAFQIIGEANREISIHRAELALIETQIYQLYSDIGRYVSRHASVHAGCARAGREQRALIDVMAALRRSIAMNHQLADKN
jgi:chromosome segregation ATPase